MKGMVKMKPRQYSLIVSEENTGEIIKGNTYIFLGEIPNMLGHCVISDKSGKILFGYHLENFTEIPEDET